MKITATFVHGRPRFAGVLAASLWTVAAAFAVAAGWLALSVAELHAEHPQLVARLARLEAQLAAAPREALPPRAELEALRRRVQALNKLAGLRGWTTPQLLGWLGGELPDNVYLVSVHHKPREGEALLVAESPSAEALTTFLLRLEREPRFAEVLLSRQGAAGAAVGAAVGTSSGGLVQFEIRVRWKA
jgi:membrane protein YqaA with SNARE-associated domain